MRFIVENKIIKFLCIVVSLLCCGCSATVNNKNNIIKDIVSFNNELDNNYDDIKKYILDNYK